MNGEVIEHDGAQARAPAAIQIFRQDLEGMKAQFAAALPKHIPMERFARVLQTAVQNNPDILRCERRSVWNAAMKAAQDGLLPDGREGAIVPYKGEAQWLPMIGGIRKKARNSGEISTWDVHAVFENDAFEYELGDEPFIRHKPALNNRGKLIAVYSVCKLKDGSFSRDIMSVEDVEKIRARSRAKGGPWADPTFYPEMAKKTVARRHAKVLPCSTDIDDLIRRDDALYEFEQAKEETRGRPTLAAALDALAGLPAPDAQGEPHTGSDVPEHGEMLGEADTRWSGAPGASADAHDAPETDEDGLPGDWPSPADAPLDPAQARALGREAGQKGVAAVAVPKNLAADPALARWWTEGHAEGVAARKKGGK